MFCISPWFSKLPTEWKVQNFRVANKPVEFALRLPNNLILPIDSKWTATPLLEQFSNSTDPDEQKKLREQIEGIFTGKITNWKEVGGNDEKIVAYSRESSSGTFEFFKESVLENKNYGSTVLLMPATGAIVQSVTQTKGAIGYIGLAYMEKTVKDLKISYDQGKTFVEGTVENAKSKKYPVTRPLYYYYLSKDEAKVKPFIDYVLSAEGQKTVTEVGYVPIK